MKASFAKSSMDTAGVIVPTAAAVSAAVDGEGPPIPPHPEPQAPTLERVIVVAGAALVPFFDDLLDVTALELALVPLEAGPPADFSAFDSAWQALLHAPLAVNDGIHAVTSAPEPTIRKRWPAVAATVRSAAPADSAREAFVKTCHALADEYLAKESALLSGDPDATCSKSEKLRDLAGVLLATAHAVRHRVCQPDELPPSKIIGNPDGRMSALAAALSKAGLVLREDSVLCSNYTGRGTAGLTGLSATIHAKAGSRVGTRRGAPCSAQRRSPG